MAMPFGNTRVVQASFDSMPSSTPLSKGAAFRSVTGMRIGNATAIPAIPLGRGAPLPIGLRHELEAIFKTDFSSVRIHIGSQPRGIGALALASGENICFAPGQYRPAGAEGRWLLAHELAHVVQQRNKRVRNPFTSSAAVVQDPALETEADRWARAVSGLSRSQTNTWRPLSIQRTRAAIVGASAVRPPRGQAVVQGFFETLAGIASASIAYVPTVATGLLIGYAVNTLTERQLGRNIVGVVTHYFSDPVIKEVMREARQAGIRPWSTQTYNGYSFKIDRYARTYEVVGTFSRRNGARKYGSIEPLVKAPFDQNGHIIADSLNGPIAACNFVGMTPFHNNAVGAAVDDATYSRMEAAVRYILDHETKYVPGQGELPYVRADLRVTLQYPVWVGTNRNTKLNFFRPNHLDVFVKAYTANGHSTEYRNPFVEVGIGMGGHLGVVSVRLDGDFDNSVPGGNRYLIGDVGYP